MTITTNVRSRATTSSLRRSRRRPFLAPAGWERQGPSHPGAIRGQADWEEIERNRVRPNLSLSELLRGRAA